MLALEETAGKRSHGLYENNNCKSVTVLNNKPNAMSCDDVGL